MPGAGHPLSSSSLVEGTHSAAFLTQPLASMLLVGVGQQQQQLPPQRGLQGWHPVSCFHTACTTGMSSLRAHTGFSKTSSHTCTIPASVLATFVLHTL